MPTFKLLWKRPMAGECPAPLAATSEVVIAADHAHKKKDYYRCFSAGQGKRLWAYSLNNAAEMDYGAGPRAMPLIYKQKVFCITALGHVFCFDLKTGKVLWEKRNPRAAKPPTWGYCSSPLIAGGRLIVNTGAASGTVAALEPDTGRRLWSMEVEAAGGYICPTPLLVDGKVLLASSDEDTRLHAFDEKGKIDDKPAAESDDLCPEISTPTVIGDIALGSTDGLVCLDLKNKLKTLWLKDDEDDLYGLLHILASKDRALVFNDNGSAVLIAPDRTGCKILGKAKLCKNTFVCPALVGRRFYVRDKAALSCYEMVRGGSSGK